MSVTRSDFKPDIRLEATGERPRVFLDMGYRQFSWWFDDCEELEGYLMHAVRHLDLPHYTAGLVMEYCRKAFGHYEE